MSVLHNPIALGCLLKKGRFERVKGSLGARAWVSLGADIPPLSAEYTHCSFKMRGKPLPSNFHSLLLSFGSSSPKL